MRRQHSDDILAREDLARLNRIPHDTHRGVAAVRDRRQARPGPFGQKFCLPVGPDKVPPPRRIFRIGPAKAQVHQITIGPPVVWGSPERRRRVRVVTVDPLTHMNCARQRHIHLQPTRMRVGGDIG